MDKETGMGLALSLIDEDASAAGFAGATTAATMMAIVHRRYGRPDVLEFRDGSRWLRVVVRREPFPTAELDWDRDALDAILEVDTDIFRGSFGTTLWRHELANLRALLQALLDQLGQHLKASFALIEHGAAFEFELLRRGAIEMRITLQTDTADVQRLQFELEADPSQLTTFVGQIDAILSRFPPAVTTTYAPDRDISPA